MLAAAVAHVVIDVAGDYVLAADAYDGIAHHSRVLAIAAAGVLVLAFAAKLLFDALGRRCAGALPLLRLVRQQLGSPARFVTLSVVCTVAILVAMEWFDCALLGVRIDDVSDLFGGSILLGMSAAVACGAFVGFVIHRALRFLVASEPAIVHFVQTVFAALAPACRLSRAVSRSRFSRVYAERGLLLSRRSRKRGPPLLVPG